MQLVEDFGLSDMTIILVWPTYPWLADDLWQEKLWKAYPYLKAYYDLENTIEDGNNTFHVCLSDNDPLIDIKRATSYYSELIEPTANKLDIQLFHKRYHFWALTKYEMEEFPELLQFC